MKRTAIAFILFALCLGTNVKAQTGASAVRGTVVDLQGNVVPNATVTLINPSTNSTRTTNTTDGGIYAFDFVPPGIYRLEVEARGFKKAVVSEVRALIAKTTEVNVQLEVGNVAETVTVSAGAGELLLNTQDATVGNNFVTRQITQLPLEARNVAALLTLQPGVTREGYSAGARADQSNVTLDGVDINEAQTNQVGGAAVGDAGSNLLIGATERPDRNTVLRLNAEAIEEFRVTVSNANATQGRSSGAQISLITKSGTNDFHGSLFEYHRNTVTTANDFFNNRAGVPRPKLIRNTFGGSLGGPIVKNRLFFFYSYEGRRDASAASSVRIVPLASMGRGELRYVNTSGGITTLTTAQLNAIFPVGINPAAVAAFAEAARKYPANDFTVGDSRPDRLLNTAGFRFNAPIRTDLNAHTARFDLNITDRQSLYLRANVQHDLFGGIPWFPDTPRPDLWSHPWGIAIGHTWTISSRFVNRFVYGLTREAFTEQGDTQGNAISFRFVFQPRGFIYTLSRVTPTHNFVDDFSWVIGNHTVQLGTNIRVIRNNRVNFANAFDSAITNPSFYAGAGQNESGAINAYCTSNPNVCAPLSRAFRSSVQNAVTALIGRFTQYTANFTFDRSGQLQPSGTPSRRRFATEEYDLYVQDVWKLRPNLTLTAGVRYGLSRPVYETNGFEVKPNIPLAEYFRRRREAEKRGVNYNEPIVMDLSGPANGRSPLYRWDKNNFQPRISVAWSPRFKEGLLGKIFGDEKSVLRGGVAIFNDYYGQQIAVTFDNLNTLGFTSNFTLPFGTYNTTNRPGPLFTGFNQDVRSLPNVIIPGRLTFPRQTPADNRRRIESSFDEAIVAPIHYNWNVTFERELPKGLTVQASYIGRLGRNLLATRDVMALSNLVDPKSGTDWYTAAGALEILRSQGAPISSVRPIPWFENLLPANLNALLRDYYTAVYGDPIIPPGLSPTQSVYASVLLFNGNDWTTLQDDMEGATGLSLFYQSQYGALSAFGSIAYSNYHAGTVSVRQRLGQTLTLDFNYTLSHSLDNASGLQTSGTYGTAFILNPIRPRDNYSSSDFDVRHIINVNSVWQLPVGRGRRFLSNANGFIEALLGGWQLSGIFRWNSGLPAPTPYDDSRWATNWNVQSNAVRIKPVTTCPTRGAAEPPKLFGCDPTGAYRSFRNARPGETGDRNVFRMPGYVSLDMGLAKSFTMPWSENHKLQIRWEVFNVTNTQHFGRLDTSRTGFGITLDPFNESPPSNWSNFTGIQGTPRIMQFGFRYSF